MSQLKQDQDKVDAVRQALMTNGTAGDVAHFLAVLNARVHELERLVRLRAPFEGGQHENTCPVDDTCDCEGKPINESVQRICETYEANETAWAKLEAR